MSNTELLQLEQSIKNSRKFVEIGDALERLRSNRDFKKLIIEGYFEKEAIRLVHLKTDANMQTAEAQRSIELQMLAIGGLSSYFNTLSVQAAMARRTLEADEQTREEMLAEEGQ